MPAKSQAQAKFFRWAEHNHAQAQAEGKAVGMSKDQMHDFSATPDAGLPKKKASTKKSRSYYGE